MTRTKKTAKIDGSPPVSVAQSATRMAESQEEELELSSSAGSEAPQLDSSSSGSGFESNSSKSESEVEELDRINFEWVSFNLRATRSIYPCRDNLSKFLSMVGHEGQGWDLKGVARRERIFQFPTELKFMVYHYVLGKIKELACPDAKGAFFWV